MIKDAMQDIIKQALEENMKKQDEIIKELAEKGFKYMILKRTSDIEENVGTVKYNYTGTNSDSYAETFKKLGYEVYELEGVRDYLEKEENENERI